jgi:hypothetical protein
MRKHHPENERTKRRYFEFIKHAKRLSESSVDQVAAAVADFEAATGYRDSGNSASNWPKNTSGNWRIGSTLIRESRWPRPRFLPGWRH